MFDEAETAETHDEDLIQLVGFFLGDEQYAVDILQVQEINRAPAITRVPRTDPAIEGVMNLRGAIVPIVNLRRRLGLPVVEAEGDRWIVVVNVEDRTVGLMVDRVSEVIRIDRSVIDQPDGLTMPIDGECVIGLAKLEGRLLLLLDCARLTTRADVDAAMAIAEAA